MIEKSGLAIGFWLLAKSENLTAKDAKSAKEEIGNWQLPKIFTAENAEIPEVRKGARFGKMKLAFSAFLCDLCGEPVLAEC
jgi:hypothetical protein